MLHHLVRIRKPWRVYPIPGCTQVATISEITAAIAMAQRQVDGAASVPTSHPLTARRLADWWDTRKIRIRQILPVTNKKARQR